MWFGKQIHWSYPGLVSLVLFVIALFWASRYLTGKRLVLMLVMVILAAPYLQSGITLIYLKSMNGIQAVDYDKQNALTQAKTTDYNKTIM